MEASMGEVRRTAAQTRRPYPNIGFFFLALLAMVVAGFTPPVPGTPFFGYFSRATTPVAAHAMDIIGSRSAAWRAVAERIVSAW